MGLLGDRALASSKFLMLDKGESVAVQFVGFKFVPNRQDPSKEDVLYEFKQKGYQKFWTNGSANVMRKMDYVNPGEWVKITRAPKLKTDGTEDLTKSKYVVEVLGDQPPEGGRTPSEVTIVSPGAARVQINGNPGGVIDPSEIPDPFGK